MKKLPISNHTPWLGFLRAAILATAAVLVSWPLTIPLGMATAALGTIVGVVLAERVGHGRLRWSGGLVLAMLALFTGFITIYLLARSTFFAQMLGPVTALAAREAIQWFLLTVPIAFALRFTAIRRPLLALLEVMAVAFAFATTFAAHRDGMVSRPFTLGDWAWSRGLDPALLFLLLGGIATLLLASLLVNEQRKRRLPLHLGALVLVALVLMVVVQVGGLPTPQTGGDLGLTGDPDAEEPADGEPNPKEQQDEGDAGSRNENQMNDLPFKDEYESQASEAPVAIVLLHDDYAPPSGVYYFRQSVFSQYNGRRLVQATRDDVDLDIIHRFPFAASEIAQAPEIGDHRQPLNTSIGLLVDHVRPFALDSPARIAPTRNPNPLRFQRAFEVRSHVQTLPYQEMLGRQPGHPGWSADLWRHYTEAPQDSRYTETADRLVQQIRSEYLRDPLAEALTIKNYLDQNGIYSRRSRHADANDPAASFLFGDLTGYCVHFAHAATYLFRSRGIPARVAAGYAVEESSRGSGSSILIRGADAHAWPEIYLEDVGWVVVDLSPETSLDETNPSADPDLQRMLGEMMRQDRWQEEAMAENGQRFSLADLARWLLKIALVLLAVAYTVKLYRFLVPRLVGPKQLPRVGYRASLDRLSDVGLRRRFGESRERFARRIYPHCPAFENLTDQHLRATLGSRQLGEGPQIRQLMTRVHQDLKQQIPTWRRWLGAAHPLSWIFSR